jgi:hypothetical protein
VQVKMLMVSAVMPAILAGAALALAWRVWRRDGDGNRGAWGGAAGLALAYAAGHLGLVGAPPFPPVEATQWLFWLALLAGLWGAMEDRLRLLARVRLGGRVILAIVLPVALARPLVTYSWGAGKGTLYVALLGIAVAALSWIVQRTAERRDGALVPALLLVVATGSAGLLVMSGSALLGQLAGLLAAASGAALVLAFWRPRVSLAGGGVTVAVLLLSGLWITGFFYAEMPLPSAILAPLSLAAGAGLAQIPAVRGRGRGQLVVISLVAASILIGAAVGFAAVEYFGSSDDYMY